MTQFEHLRKYYHEETPSWLLNIDNNSAIPWKEFFAERTVFYPGSALDPYTVNLFTRSQSAHCFVNVDYHFPREKLEAELKKPMFPGYSIIYERNLSESVFLAMFSQPYSYVTDLGLENFDGSHKSEYKFHYAPYSLENFDMIKHFVKFLVFEKNPHNPSPRAKRFALLYIGGDAFPVFNALYANKNANLFAMQIEDYGYGSQYAYFQDGQLLHTIAQKTGALPQLLLGMKWNGYEYLVEDTNFKEERNFGHGTRRIFKIKPTEGHPQKED